MDTHVKVLGVLYIVVSALHFCAALFLLLAVGGAASIVGLAADPNDAAIAVPILGIAGTAIAGMLLILSLPGLIAGWGLLGFKPWARIVGLVLSVINLLNIPFGTAVGIYGLWVLFHKDTERLFNRSPTVPTTA